MIEDNDPLQPVGVFAGAVVIGIMSLPTTVLVSSIWVEDPRLVGLGVAIVLGFIISFICNILDQNDFLKRNGMTYEEARKKRGHFRKK